MSETTDDETTQQAKRELVATLDVEAWNAMTPGEKAAAVAAFNKVVNERRAACGLPPLKKRNPDEEK